VLDSLIVREGERTWWGVRFLRVVVTSCNDVSRLVKGQGPDPDPVQARHGFFLSFSLLRIPDSDI
jgi:hypothetical protein